MTYELVDTCGAGRDEKGQFQYLIIVHKISDEIINHPFGPLVGLPALSSPKPAITPQGDKPTIRTRCNYRDFPDQSRSWLRRLVHHLKFPDNLSATFVNDHPQLNHDENAFNWPLNELQVILITFPREKYGISYWDILTQWLEPEQINVMKSHFAELKLAIVPVGKSCHCSDYYPGVGCGYKGGNEAICMNCASLCPICYRPVASLYNEGQETEGCYDCNC